jgi:LAS superfamily LD-carboxypeptidase LdcB
MQVKVSVADVSAQARAVLDPSLLRPSVVAWDRSGLQPALAAAVNSLVIAGHGAIRVVSGYRSRAAQAALWGKALQRYGNAKTADDWVAPPGRSMHERGLAVDLGGDLELAAHLIQQQHLPMYQPLRNEPWHFELRGSRAAQ